MSESEAQRQYTFCLSDLPKLDLQVDKGMDFSAWRLQWKSYSSLSGLNRGGLATSKSPELMFFERNVGYSTKPWTHRCRKKGRISNNRHTTEICWRLFKWNSGAAEFSLLGTATRWKFWWLSHFIKRSHKDLQILFRQLRGESICNQIIEDVCDGDTIEGLLQENNLTLATAIAKCHSKEAAKKHCLDIADLGSEIVAAVRQPYQPVHNTLVACPECGSAMHVWGCCQCPAYNRTYVTKSGTLQKYVTVNRPNSNLVAPSSNLMQELSMYSHSNTVKNGTYSYTRCMKGLQNLHQQLSYKYRHPQVHTVLMSFQIQGRICIYVLQDIGGSRIFGD